MFITALFTIAEIWEQLKCPSTDKWIKKLWCVYNGILLSHKKKEILPFATTQMDLEGTMLSEMSDRQRQILYDFTYM